MCQLAEGSRFIQIFPDMIVEENRGLSAFNCLLYPLCVLVRIIISRIGFLKASNIEAGFPVISAKPLKDRTQVFTNDILIISEQPARSFRHTFKNENMLLIRRNTEILVRMIFAFPEHLKHLAAVDIFTANEDWYPDHLLRIPELFCHLTQILRIRHLNLSEKVNEGRLSVLTKPDHLLLSLVTEHRLDRHLDDERDGTDLNGITRDADDSFPSAVYIDDHVDPGTNIGYSGKFRRVDDIVFSMDDPVGDLVILADALRIPARYDDSVFVHNIYIVVSMFCYLLDKFFREVSADHG